MWCLYHVAGRLLLTGRGFQSAATSMAGSQKVLGGGSSDPIITEFTKTKGTHQGDAAADGGSGGGGDGGSGVALAGGAGPGSSSAELSQVGCRSVVLLRSSYPASSSTVLRSSFSSSIFLPSFSCAVLRCYSSLSSRRWP